MPELSGELPAEFISIVDETVNCVLQAGLNKIGLLGTPATLKSGLYTIPLEKQGIGVIAPTTEEVHCIEDIIRSTIGGGSYTSSRNQLDKIVMRMKKEGAQGVILGCTELPLVCGSFKGLTTFNTLEILSVALLREYYGNHSLIKYNRR